MYGEVWECSGRYWAVPGNIAFVSLQKDALVQILGSGLTLD